MARPRTLCTCSAMAAAAFSGSPVDKRIQDGLMFGDRVVGVGDAHSPEQAEALNLPAEGGIGGHHELVARLLRDQPVEPLVGLEVAAEFGKRRARAARP